MFCIQFVNFGINFGETGDDSGDKRVLPFL